MASLASLFGAHPRSRGENSGSTGRTRRTKGSSPLTRGKPWRPRRKWGPPGLIPAHAGKTHTRRPFRHHPGAHPRSRGENAAYVGDVPNDTGSSPLTRGKRGIAGGPSNRSGLIPAHAGKTARDVLGAALVRAHPRSRGENDGGFAWKAGFPGSSPLTRGKRDRGSAGPRAAGLIPAHAGKTGRRPPAYRRAWAHPRSRGENADRSAATPIRSGSSPLTRGKPRAASAAPSKRRLIPAHAGKTDSAGV